MSDPLECPRCGVSIVVVDDEFPSECPVCGADLEAPEPSQIYDASVPYKLTTPPVDSKIQILEVTEDKLMLSIPAGGSSGNTLGCAAIIWVIFTGLFTAAFASAGLKVENFEGNAWVPIVLLGLLWLVGLLMLWFAIRLKYTRGYLFLSRDRAVHQRILLGRKKNTEVSLGETSYARLIESYQQNDNPVYYIGIEGTDGTTSFGTGLDANVKEWYVETINRFIAAQYESTSEGTPAAAIRDPYGVRDSMATCPACGRILPDDKAERCGTCGASLERSGPEIVSAHLSEVIEPESLPDDFPVRVSRSMSGDWKIAYRLNRMTNMQGIGCLFVLGAIWESFVIAFTGLILQSPGPMKAVLLFVSIPFHLIGLGLLLLALFVRTGSFRLRLGTEKSCAFWGIGPLGYSKYFSTSSITEIVLKKGEAFASSKNKRLTQAERSRLEGISCILMAAGKRVPVTSGAKESDARTTAGLIRYCLHDLGYRLQDE